MKHERHIKREGGGTTVTCDCGRLWWSKSEAVATDYWRNHLPREEKK